MLGRLHKWFNNEREHRHEVRSMILQGRLEFELEYERDRQLVLEQQGNDWVSITTSSKRASTGFPASRSFIPIPSNKAADQ